MSVPLLATGMALALLGPPLVLQAFRIRTGETTGPAPRLALWVVMGVALLVGFAGSPAGIRPISPARPGIATAGWAVGGALFVLLLWAPLQALQRRLGARPLEETEQFRKLAGYSLGYRVFLVVTAGVVEEVLYRGYGIGLGAVLVGGAWPAAGLTLAAFTGAHWAWDRSHLLTVAGAGTALTLLFLASGDLLACVLAHVAVDAVGLLLTPALMARGERGEAS